MFVVSRRLSTFVYGRHTGGRASVARRRQGASRPSAPTCLPPALLGAGAARARLERPFCSCSLFNVMPSHDPAPALLTTFLLFFLYSYKPHTTLGSFSIFIRRTRRARFPSMIPPRGRRAAGRFYPFFCYFFVVLHSRRCPKACYPFLPSASLLLLTAHLHLRTYVESQAGFSLPSGACARERRGRPDRAPAARPRLIAPVVSGHLHHLLCPVSPSYVCATVAVRVVHSSSSHVCRTLLVAVVRSS